MSKTRKSLRDEIEEVQNIVRNTVFQELKSRDRELEKLQNVSKELETFSKHFEKVSEEVKQRNKAKKCCFGYCTECCYFFIRIQSFFSLIWGNVKQISNFLRKKYTRKKENSDSKIENTRRDSRKKSRTSESSAKEEVKKKKTIKEQISKEK